MRSTALLVAVLPCLAACGKTLVQDPASADAGEASDLAMDGGPPEAEGGVPSPTDAGAPSDMGPSDAGVPSDMGPTDAGAPPGPEATLVFPPAPGLTNLDVLDVRARLDVPATATVRFETVAGSVPASFHERSGTWVGAVPLELGTQEVRVRADGSLPTTLVSVRRGVASGRLVAATWDAMAEEYVLVEQRDFRSRVLRMDPAAGSVTLALEPPDGWILVQALHEGSTTYLTGYRDGTPTLAALRDGVLTSLTTLPALPQVGRGTIAYRRRSNEVLVGTLFATPGPRAAVFVDAETGSQRRIEVSGLALAYDPRSDRILTYASSGALRLIDAGSGASREVPTDDALQVGGALLFNDPVARRFLFADRTPIDGAIPSVVAVHEIELGVEARLGRRRGLFPASEATARSDTGALVAACDGFAWPNFIQPCHGEVLELPTAGGDAVFHTPEPVGGGAPLSLPSGIACRDDSLVVADGGRVLGLDLDPSGTERRLLATAEDDLRWSSVTFGADDTELFATGASDLWRIVLGGAIERLPGPAIGRLEHFGDVTVIGAGTRDAELVDTRYRRLGLRGRPLARPGDAPRTFAEVGHDTGPMSGGATAAAQNERTGTLGVLALNEEFRYRVFEAPAGGGTPRERRVLDDFPSHWLPGDMVWRDGAYYLSGAEGILVLDDVTLEERGRHALPRAPAQLTAPNDDGVGFATLPELGGVAAYDDVTGAWILIAR
ncbi:MAG: hypothetical protein AAGH15_01290 [Myxococcota bacterium]